MTGPSINTITVKPEKVKRDKGNGGCNWKKPTMTHSLEEHQRRDTKHVTQKALTTHIFWILIKFTLSNNPFFQRK